MSMKKNNGFSIIELMITIGIIGILTLLALPFYKSYIARVYIAEGIVIAADERIDLVEKVASYLSAPWHSQDIYTKDTAMPNPGLVEIESRFQNGSIAGVEVNIRLDTKVLFGAEFGDHVLDTSIPLTLTYELVSPSSVYHYTTTPNDPDFPDEINHSSGLEYNFIWPGAYYYDRDENPNWVCGISKAHFSNSVDLQYIGVVMAALPPACRNIFEMW